MRWRPALLIAALIVSVSAEAIPAKASAMTPQAIKQKEQT
ncbi:hypothetical protein RR42_m1983 [Cupriavidus basilensis]|uniref:Uncharacterized protein n=1 Tax=Cupriavidus basilensis TaxID=68895 RepID=A0A0C4Y8U8_9BURK|nr:hypothetical protein RR42_m1983 [Cupriavidus basilensis]